MSKVKGEHVILEARQTILGLRFKRIIKKDCRPVSVQIETYSVLDQQTQENKL